MYMPPTRTGLVLMAVVTTAAACVANEVAVVRLTTPARGGDALLEDGMKINVSHVNIAWKTRWNDGGQDCVLQWNWTTSGGFGQTTSGVREQISFDNQSAQLWVNLVRARLGAGLQDAAQDAAVKLEIIDRDHLGERLGERDLELAGITESTRGRPVKEKRIDAKVYGKVDIDVHFQTGGRKTISGAWLNVYRFCGWHVHGGVRTADKQKIRRIITINAQFTMEDGVTGRIWKQHQSDIQPIDTEKPGVFFGRDKRPIDFNQPDEAIIREFLELEVQKFVAQLLPVSITTEVSVEASRHRDCERGVKELANGAFHPALDSFQRAINDNVDDYRAQFGAGVACEALGDFERARTYYEQAVQNGRNHAQNLTAFEQALNRISKHS